MINQNEIAYAEKLKKEYSAGSKEVTKLDQLKALDKKVKKPAMIFSYIFGTIGALILGVGMCLAMKIIGGTTAFMIVGIVVGSIGIVLVSINYSLYKTMVNNRKATYSKEILTLSDELLSNKD